MARKAARDQSKLFQNNLLIYGDNLKVLRNPHLFRDESVDLIYLDPPFKPAEKYNVLFRARTGTPAAAQVRAFEDAWHWDEAAKEAYHDTMENAPTQVRRTLDALKGVLGQSDMFAYLCMMAPRLVELHRVLRPTGSIYLHCDAAASHYLKILLDSVFGAPNFKNEIIWSYKRYTAASNRFQRLHDVLLFYGKTPDMAFNDLRDAYGSKSGKADSHYKQDEEGRWYRMQKRAGEKAFKIYLSEGRRLGDVWEMPIINASARERLGYPTQKPLALLDRIVQASSNEGDTVLDPFCGCGTTVAAAHNLGRKWVGIDIAYDAIRIIRGRLAEAGLTEKVDYEVWGEPESHEDAMKLAEEDKYQFEWWAVRRLGAREITYKKGADERVDGRLVLRAERSGDRLPEAIISVKAGRKSGPHHVSELRGVIEREKAEIGVLVTRGAPTAAMKKEASVAGEYTDGKDWYPRIQLLTAEDIINGVGVKYPAKMLEEKKPARRKQAAARKSTGRRGSTRRRA